MYQDLLIPDTALLLPLLEALSEREDSPVRLEDTSMADTFQTVRSPDAIEVEVPGLYPVVGDLVIETEGDTVRLPFDTMVAFDWRARVAMAYALERDLLLRGHKLAVKGELKKGEPAWGVSVDGVSTATGQVPVWVQLAEQWLNITEVKKRRAAASSLFAAAHRLVAQARRKMEAEAAARSEAEQNADGVSAAA